MISKIFRSLLIFCITSGVLSCAALTAFAEEDGEKNCSGMVMGTTVEENTNAGQTYFDSHGGPANMAGLPLAKKSKYEQAVDLSIVGLALGLAPASREQAACAEAEAGTYDGTLHEYGLQGYAWNDNLGFISFYCKDGQNAGIACGGFPYGVKIGPEVNGARDLFGYAWNSVFGYIKFKGTGASYEEVGPYTLAEGESVNVSVDGDVSSHGILFFEVIDGNKPRVIHQNDNTSVILNVGETTDFPGKMAITVTDFQPEQAPVIAGPAGLLIGQPIVIALSGKDHTVTFNAFGNPNFSATVDGTALSLKNGVRKQVGASDLYITANAVAFWFGSVMQFSLDDGGTPAQITFYAQSINPQEFDYGVSMDANGNLSGYAWTQAGIWMNFSGVQIELPGKDVAIVEGETWCKTLPKPGACVEVTTTVGGGGNEEYGIDIYLKDPVEGTDPLDIADYNVSLTFTWEDTVKSNQLAFSKVFDTLNGVSKPWAGGKGGVLYKPITVTNADLKTLFTEVPGDKGHYVLNQKIISFAPTTDKNFSMTTSTTPAMPFSNEVFADKLALPPPNNTVWSIKNEDTFEENNLILKSINYTIIPENGAAVLGVVYPNGKGNGYEFQFEPLISVKDLYTSDNDDSIIGFRGLPIGFYVKAAENVYMKALKADGVGTFSKKEIILALDYDKTETLQGDACNGTQYKNFDYHFYDPQGQGLFVEPSYSSVTKKWSFPVVNPTFVHAMKYSLASLGVDPPVQINAIAELLDYNDALAEYNAALAEYNAASEGEPPSPPALPCDSVTGPTLYSVITYKAKDTKSGIFNTVFYYGNKLPRLLTEGFNPSAVVTGNIYSSNAFSATSSHTTQATGNVAIDIFRNTINENIEKQLGKQLDEISAVDTKCTITKLGNVSKDDVTVTCENDATPYETFEVDGEYVIYFKGTDVVLKLEKEVNGDSKLAGKWALIVQDAALYIDDDIYRDDTSLSLGKLAIVVLRSYAGECKDNNTYLKADVKNIDANIVSDCSLFSYDSDIEINETTGLPNWTYDEMINKLNVQKFFRGSLAIRNTLGGADLPAIGKEYIQLGTGEVYPLPVTEAQTFEAMMYDINYFAFFRIKVEMSDTGLPVDQKCKKALTVDDMIQIKNKNEGLSDVGVLGPDNVECDGIDVTSAYDAVSGKGDLMPEVDTTILAKGLDNEKDFAPLYIDYVPSDSFVFKKAGETTTK